MAAPAGSGAVEAYKNTKSRKATPGVYVKDFVPTASPRLMDESALRDVASVKNTLEAAKHTDPFKSTAPRELPPGTYGGRKKSRRQKRRGGALTKPLPALLEDLNRDPSKATLENVISDFKTSNIRYLEDRGARLEAQLREGRARLDYLVQLAKEDIEAILGGRAGGRRRKTTRRRK
jgi:hypothetical protein